MVGEITARSAPVYLFKPTPALADFPGHITLRGAPQHSPEIGISDVGNFSMCNRVAWVVSSRRMFSKYFTVDRCALSRH